MNDDEEMLKIAQSLRREFDELGEVTDVTKKRLKEILEDKNKRERSLQKFWPTKKQLKWVR